MLFVFHVLIKTFPVANQKGSVTFSGLLCCIGASGPCVALARLDRFFVGLTVTWVWF